MRRKISLYIGDQLVDLGDQSFILFNYTMENMGNPTIVRNSYSQQITLKGTPRNNKVFGGMWRSDRVTQYGQSEVGVYFSAARKTPFTIYNEMNEILESGYCKLDRVTRKRGNCEYTISLYGGLGSFLFSLSYDEDGNKRTLADLKYTGQNAGDDELDFVINRSSVAAAWARISGGGSAGIWDIINFAPAYNGYPSGLFDADKAVFNAVLAGITIPQGYNTQYGGLTLASMPKKYTEWETKDLRSYLQRPVIKFSKVIDAICQSYNNGGYSVELDDQFFVSSNPYYDKTYLTLPLINSLEVQISEGGGYLSPSIGVSTGRVDIPDGGNPSTSYIVNLELIPSVSIVSGSASAYYLNSVDRVEDEGEIYYGNYINLINYYARAYDSDGNLLQERSVFFSSTPLGMENEVDGHFDGNGGWIGQSAKMSFECQGIAYIILERDVTADASGRVEHTPNPNIIWADPDDYDSYVDVSYYDETFPRNLNTYHYTTSESARSGVTITKKMLLNTEKTPADYLLSFCKMFGLVFVCDKGEKKIQILQKKRFYQNEVVDLTDRIDIGQNISTLPFAFDSRWYDFKFPYENGEYAKYYANIYDRVFGLQRVNTGFEFNADAKDLLDGIVFRGACEVLENSKYFVEIVDGTHLIPAIFQDSGGSFSLLATNGTREDFDIPAPPTGATRSWWNNTDKTFDFLSKAQFHNADNAAFEERDTLLFFNGMKSLSGITSRIALTDDTPIMMAMNENTPCWILDAATIISGVSALSNLPVFSRYIWNGSSIVNSLDFGTPGEISIPDATFAQDSSIYVKFWQRYISDRYDDDSRVMTCRVDLSGLQVNESLLRRFFYFNGSIWAINKIINHSLTTWDDTECEFVKVQDKDNYLN